MTDNKNRAVGDLRHTFSRKGGSLAEGGAVSWMFSQKGVIKASGALSEDELFEKLLDFEIEDIKKEEDLFFITCDTKSLDEVKTAVIATGLTLEAAEVEWVAQNKAEVSEADEEKTYEFLEALDNLEDVQNVYSNVK